MSPISLAVRFFSWASRGLTLVGDPSPTIPRSYMGDPAKFRLVHGGGEVPVATKGQETTCLLEVLTEWFLHEHSRATRERGQDVAY